MPNALASDFAGGAKKLFNLFAVLTRLQPEQLKLLYGDLFTEGEAVKLASRLEVARQLLEGRHYLEIQKNLKVSANTVSQIQKVLKNGGAGFRAASLLLTSLRESKKVLPETNAEQKVLQPVSNRRSFFSVALEKFLRSPVG